MSGRLRFPRVRSPMLVVALVTLLLAYPELEGNAPRWLISLLVMFVLASAAYTVGTSRSHLVIALTLGVPAITMRFLFPGHETLGSAWSNGFQLLFLGYVVVMLFGFVLRPGDVGVEKLCAAASMYLLMGIAWVGIYQLTELREPGSFSVPGGGEPRYSDLMYFSYVTLTTLGYGEITPVTERARSFAILEALSGSFFMTVLVARLVSMYKRADKAAE